MNGTPPVVVRASAEVFRIFDVAQEIDLPVVEQLLTGRAPVARIRLVRAQPKAIAFDDPPVVTDLLGPALEYHGMQLETRASARLYGFGVLSLSLEVLLPRPMPWPEFEEFAREVEREVEGLSYWQSQLGSLLDALRPALVLPERAHMEEDYSIVTVRELEPALSAPELTKCVDLVPLLTQERRPLSDAARADVLRHTHSYYTDDLVVLTWDRAFVLEPSPDDDIADVLEVATAQLLELRYYDAVLDRELPLMYQRAAEVRGSHAFSRGRYARAANQMRALVAEVTEITEKVDNALKVTEDVYLARVYTTALELFRIRYWAGSIDRKLSLMRDVYTALYDEAVATRAEWLEAAIVLLIVFEILMAFLL